MRVVRVALPLSSAAVSMRTGEGNASSDWRVPSLADLARLENNTHVLVPWASTAKVYTECGKESALKPGAGGAGGAGAEMPSVEGAAVAEPAAASSASEEKLEMLSKELTKLREMIAAVVTKQDSFVPMMAGGGGGGGGSAAPPPLPSGSSLGPEYQPFLKMIKHGVPRGAVDMKCQQAGLNPALLDGGRASALGGPPPPPPPLPPPGFMLEKKKESMADLVKKNRKGQKVATTRGPSMMDILSGIGSIKLKNAGDRAPNSDEQSDSTAPADPAAMIAAALRRKFAHRANSSPSAETAAWAQREKDMAERKRLQMEADKPKFGLHMLKKSGGKSRMRAPLSAVGNTNIG